MADLRKELRQASFRGIGFDISSAEDSYGRRSVTHTYPQFDTPYTEDMGKAPNTFNFEAFLVGDDYLSRARKLIEACNKAGAGLLVHPWLGSQQVVCMECRPRWNLQGLGECRIQLAFQEEGKALYPDETQNYAEITKEIAQSALETFLARFKELYSVLGASWLPKQMTNLFNQAMGMVNEVAQVAGIGSSSLSELLAQIEDATNAASEIIEDGNQVSDIIDDVINSLPDTINDPATALSSMLTLTEFTASGPSLANNTTWQQTQSAFTQLVNRLALVHGITTAVDADYGSKDEALSVRDELVESLDRAMTQASDSGETESFEALRELNRQVVDTFQEKAGCLPGLVQLPTANNPAPALVLAYDLYQDLNRETELLTRNPGIINPSFPPGGETLEVTSA